MPATGVYDIEALPHIVVEVRAAGINAKRRFGKERSKSR
jgi:hypothetical protein